jgi:phage/plasmid-like protein (TIGR03299 family)
MTIRMRAPRFAADSLEARNVQAAIKAGGFDFTPVFKPLFLENEASLGGIEAVGSHRALVRSDNGRLLGIHGGQYTPLADGDGFAGIQPLLDAGDARIIDAYSLAGGAKTVIEAEVGESRVPVKVGDEIRLKISFTNSHDGSSPATWAYNVERLVCLNGMTARERIAGGRARHTAGIHRALDAWRLEFEAQRARMAETAGVFRAMASRKLNDRALVAFVRETLSEGAGADDKIVVRGVDRIVELAHEAPGADPGTLWGGLNAVTYWATHERGRSDDARLTANVFGTGGQLIERATAVATALVEHLPMNDIGRQSYANHATARSEFERLLSL